MAKQNVVISTCDGCGKEVKFPLNKKASRTELPSNWLHIEGITNKTTVFERDLCEECKVDVLNAAMKGDTK